MISSGVIEEGVAVFSGQSSKDVILQLAESPAVITATVVELPDTYNTGSSYNLAANKEADIPSRYYGTVQVAAYWLEAKKFRITLSAPFYGNIRWIVQS